MKIWRILVSSPSDVSLELSALRFAVETTNRALEASGKDLRLQYYRWKTDVSPGAHETDIQLLIDASLRFEDADIVVGIFWKRLGSPVYDAPSGCAHEIRLAHEAWKKSGRPRILAYFNQEPVSLTSLAEAENCVELFRFKEELKERKILFREYDGEREFERALTSDLLTAALGPAAQPFLTSSVQCRAQASLPDLRAESQAERIGDIVLVFAFPPHEPQDRTETHFFDIDVQLNTGVSRPRSGLLPQVAVQSMVSGSSVIAGRFLEGEVTRVRFENVPIRPVLDTHVVITDVFAHCVFLGVNATFAANYVIAKIDVREGTKAVHVANNEQSVGLVRASMTSSIIAAQNSRLHEGDMVPDACDELTAASPRFYLCFREGFAGAFKNINEECGTRRSLVESNKRLASWGTRCAAHFSSVPDWAELYVTARDEASVEASRRAPRAVLVLGNDANGAGGTPMFESEDRTTRRTTLGTGLMPVPQNGLVVWEWVSEELGDTGAPREVLFGVVVLPRAQSIQGSNAELYVSVSLAPFYSGAGRWLHALIPSFAPLGSAPRLFRF
jgi:hypothetical protein